MLLLAGCASVLPAGTQTAAASAQADARWQRHTLAGNGLPLAYWQPGRLAAGQTLVVYVEGDGRAYASRDIVSADPTPLRPLALQLALADGRPNVAYLARPCQYGGAAVPPCAPRYWTSHRFSPEVVARLSQALDAMKADTGAAAFELIGYSGGGALAVLLAAHRADVVALQTVAGNLDHAAWSAWHGVTPLSGSFNAADVLPKIANLPQVHWVGRDDRVVPAELTRALLARQDLAGRLREVDAGHADGWRERWPALQRREAWP
ncbi:alpha/beta hydrolase [Crenobacter caeni]|uniref:alpha/beta hydrolase n=1 Tax=Crenobacter caeni TaxID=2705474 RepID=UPI0013D59EE2|nr:alpha/beta hydrolase [Crenobacter caeni]